MRSGNEVAREVDVLLDSILAKNEQNKIKVLELGWNEALDSCPIRQRLRSQADRYTVIVSSLLEHAQSRQAWPRLAWEACDLRSDFALCRLAARDFTLVIIPQGDEQDVQHWLSLFRADCVLLSGDHQQWQWYRKPVEITDNETSSPFPLTNIQYAYWLGRSQALALGGVACHVYFEWQITDFDLPRFERAWNRVISRHGMMRAVVDESGQQRILDETPWYSITTDDWRGYTQPDNAKRVAVKREGMCQQVLDASCWPLFDLRASLEPANRCRIHLDLDLLMFDVQSFHIVLAELDKLYHDPAIQLAETNYSFRDYQMAEVKAREQADFTADRDWWLEHLDNIAPAPVLPLRCQPAEIDKPVFRRIQRRMEPEVWQRLASRAAKMGITPSSMLLAAFSEILALWSSDARFTLNLTHFNRRPHHPDVGQLVGDFTSVLLLTVDCSEQKNFKQRASDIQSELWARLAHSRFGGVDVLRELTKQQGMAESSAMPVVFTSLLGMDLDTLVSGADLLGEPDFLYTATPQVWLDHQVMVRKGSLEYNWIVIDNLFPDGMIDAMFDSYGKLLDMLAFEQDCWQQPALLPLPAKQQQVRVAVNATTCDLELAPLHTGFFRMALQQPDADALITSGDRVSYRVLSEQALAISMALRDCAQVQCQPVVLALPKGVEQIAAVLGIMAAGAILVPASTDWPLARLSDVVTQSGAIALIADDDTLRHFPALSGLSGHVRYDGKAADFSPLLPDLNQIAYIIFTSGSTGKPKGVAMSHAATANTLADVSQRLGLSPTDRVFGISDLSFDLAIFDVFATLSKGAALVLPDAQSTRDAAHWLTLVQRHGVTLWNSVPALLEMLLEQAQADRQALTTLRQVMLSGDWIGCDLPAALQNVAPGARFIGLGGATEAAIWSNWFDVNIVEPHWNAIPYGFPLANQNYHILDSLGRDRPDGVSGELYIGGAGLAHSYWGDDERTAAAFLPHPRSGERLYRTGDLARYRPDGCIEFLGRSDDQVKIGGHRIELGEIESVLQRQPHVRYVAAQVCHAPGDTRRLAAWIVAETDARDESYHRRLCAQGQTLSTRLPELQRVTALKKFQMLSEKVAPDMMLANLMQLGFISSSRWSIEKCEQLHIDPRFKRLIGRWHDILVQHGVLGYDERGYSLIASAPNIEALTARIAAQQQAIFANLDWVDNPAIFRDWLFSSASVIQQVMTQSKIATSQLFPKADSDASESVYQGNIVAEYLGNIAAGLLKAYLKESDTERVSILEIGAGVGGLSISTLPVLAEISPEGEYHYTDVSPYFSRHAEARFGHFSPLRTGHFDINQPLGEQSYDLGEFDAVLAANVLHNAHQLAKSLSDIYQLLRPGGALIILEATRDKILQWVTTAWVLEHAAEEGDNSLDSPLRSEEQWRCALQDAGFDIIDSWPQSNMTMGFVGQQVIMAVRPSLPAVLTPAVLQRQLGDVLPSYMVPEHYFFLDKMPLSSNGKVDRQRLPKPCFHIGSIQTAGELPATDSERELAKLWCELLNIEQVGRQQDFFTAGGDSLLATRLVARLSTLREHPVSIRLLFMHPKLMDMAQALDELETQGMESAVVVLNQKHERKLVCVHASDGFATPYYSLATRTKGMIQCLGLQASGLEADQPVLDDITQQANHYLQAVRAQGAQQPWCLMGWSMGVYVVMEIAQILHQQGETIAQLVFIDPVPQQAMYASAASEYALWQSMLSPELVKAASQAQLTAPGFARLAEGERLNWWRKALPSQQSLADAELALRIAVVKGNVNAMVNYQQRPLPDIPVNVYLASDHPALWGDVDKALTPVVPSQTKFITVPDSTHWDIITQPFLIDELVSLLGSTPRSLKENL